MVLQELVQPKALIFIGIYLGTGLAIGWSVITMLAVVLSGIFTPKVDVEAYMKEFEDAKKKYEDK